MKLQDLHKQVTEYAINNSDVYAQSRSMKFGAGGTVELSMDDQLFGHAALNAIMNDYAKAQVSYRFDAPKAGWLWDTEHCPADLAADIMNKLAAERDDKRLFVRLNGETVRAVLSDEYTPFDNHELIDLTVKAVQTMGIEPEVVRPVVGDELSAYVLFPQVTVGNDPRDHGRGGNLHPAIHISNSERGGGTARINSAVFTGFCQNGLIYGWDKNETMSVRHRFISSSVMGALVAQNLAIALDMSEQAAKAFVAAQEVRIPAPDLSPIVDRWARQYGLSVSTRDNWLGAITGEVNRNNRPEDPRLFDVINGATWLSQQYEVVEAIRIERMAGDMLERYTSRIEG